MVALKEKLKEKHKPYVVTDRDVLSSTMYPKVFDEYVEHRKRFSDLLPQVPTRAFLEGLEVDKELCIEVDKGRQLYVTLKAVGELLPNGRREVFFNLNGLPRLVEVEDRRAKEAAKGTASTLQAVRERANPDVLGEVGAPMSGTVIEVKVAAGEIVKAGQPLVAVSAMKMETQACAASAQRGKCAAQFSRAAPSAQVAAPMAGLIRHVAVVTGDSLAAGDLLLIIEKQPVA